MISNRFVPRDSNFIIDHVGTKWPSLDSFSRQSCRRLIHHVSMLSFSTRIDVYRSVNDIATQEQA